MPFWYTLLSPVPVVAGFGLDVGWVFAHLPDIVLVYVVVYVGIIGIWGIDCQTKIKRSFYEWPDFLLITLQYAVTSFPTAPPKSQQKIGALNKAYVVYTGL